MHEATPEEILAAMETNLRRDLNDRISHFEQSLSDTHQEFTEKLNALIKRLDEIETKLSAKVTGWNW